MPNSRREFLILASCCLSSLSHSFVRGDEPKKIGHVEKKFSIGDVDFTVTQLHETVYLHSGIAIIAGGIGWVETPQEPVNVLAITALRAGKEVLPTAGIYEAGGKELEVKWLPEKNDNFEFANGVIRFKKNTAAKLTVKIGTESANFVVKSKLIKVNVNDPTSNLIKVLGKPDSTNYVSGKDYISPLGELRNTSYTDWRWDKYPGLSVRVNSFGGGDGTVNTVTTAPASYKLLAE